MKNDFENLLKVQLFLGCNIWENIEKTWQLKLLSFIGYIPTAWPIQYDKNDANCQYFIVINNYNTEIIGILQKTLNKISNALWMYCNTTTNSVWP